MCVKIKASFDLLWRVLGSNILLIVIGVLNIINNFELAAYVVFSNTIFILFVSYQVLRKNLTMESRPWEILLIYFIYRLVGGLIIVNVDTKYIINILSMLLEALWIYKFYISEKIKRGD